MGKRSRSSTDEATLCDQDTGIDEASSPAKMVELDTNGNTSRSVMQCSLPPHPLISFSSTNDFDIHYAKEHTNRCTSCGRNLPSPHYLLLHIDENHNPLREARAAQGEKTYACFVEGCERKCSTPQKRRLHLIDKHMFPKTYDFNVINRGTDSADSMLVAGQKRRLSCNAVSASHNLATTRRGLTLTRTPNMIRARSDSKVEDRRLSSEQDGQHRNSHRTTEASASLQMEEIDSLEQSLASLKFVPNSVRLQPQRNKTKR